MTWPVISSVANTIYNACFGTAHWLLASEYFSIARIMPAALKGIQVTASQKRNYYILKVSVLALNVLASLLVGIFMFCAYYFIYKKDKGEGDRAITAQSWCLWIYSILEIVSGFFILYAVFEIRKYIKKGVKPSQINWRNLTLHATAFLLYTISLCIDNVFQVIYYYSSPTNTQKSFENYLIADLVSNVFNFVGQLLLCKIFYQFGKPNEAVVVQRSMSEDSSSSRSSHHSDNSAHS